MTKQLHAEIAGGGIAGLSAAIFLARSGWSVTVHEQAPDISELGAGLLLKPNSLNVLREAGVTGRLPRVPAVVDGYECRGPGGNVIYSYRHTGDLAAYCPLRQEVITALRDTALAVDVDIQTDSRIIAARPEGILIGAGGEEYPADLVIGADGWKSAVRDSLGLTARVAQLNHGATRTVIPRLPDDTDTILIEHWSGKRRMGLTPVNPDLLYIFLSSPEADARGKATPIDVDTWRATFPSLSDSLIERLRAASAVHHAYSYVRTETWHRGRVAILGDAANALPPTLAQGAGLAIMNAGGLAKELRGRSDISAALVAWERRYRPLTVHTQRWSMRYLRATNSWIGRVPRLQAMLLAVSRVPAVNRRVRLADRMTVGESGPVVIAAPDTFR